MIDKICDACDGDGSRMDQWAKESMIACGGHTMPFTDGRPGFYYANSKGQEIPYKTIGGYCEKCNGTGKEPTC
jgi:hypothetical protein